MLIGSGPLSNRINIGYLTLFVNPASAIFDIFVLSGIVATTDFERRRFPVEIILLCVRCVSLAKGFVTPFWTDRPSPMIKVLGSERLFEPPIKRRA